MSSSATGAPTGPWPTELRLQKDRKTLVVSFDSGQSFELPAEYLRVRSPSAEVQGHSPAERRTVAGKRDVTILELHPVGNYAVRIVFDDHAFDRNFQLGLFVRARPKSRDILAGLSRRAGSKKSVARSCRPLIFSLLA